MSKLRKFMMGFVFALIVVMGVNAGSSNVKAASTKNFKGNLNVTYKNSEWNSKITIKKVNSKKVSVKVVAGGLNQGSYNGTISSKNAINMKLDSRENIVLNWNSKTSFTAKRPKGGFSSESIQMARLLCNSLNNTKYTQVKTNSTVYYCSEGNSYRPTISIKGNTITIKGNLTKGTKKRYADVKGTVTKLKKATRTFKMSKSVKFYGNGGEEPNPSRMPKKDAISSINDSQGLGNLPFILTVKNDKVTRIDFYS